MLAYILLLIDRRVSCDASIDASSKHIKSPTEFPMKDFASSCFRSSSPCRDSSRNRFGTGGLTVAAAIALAGTLSVVSGASAADENPAPMLQWFECPWNVMERRMVDIFVSGYGSVWVPPPSKAYVWPGSSNQNSASAGYDPFDRFDLGKPNATTAFGTEQYFSAAVEEYHRAGLEVYIDTIVNHNGGRQTGAGFMNDGGYPGLWMNPPTPMRDKLPTDNWGDFHAGIASGYYQSEAPQSIRYCLLQGDLVSLIDINQGSNNIFIRQPTVAGNLLNIPGGTYFNRVNPANARFYPDTQLGFDAPVNNPGMSYADGLGSGIFAAPCNIPVRNEPATTATFGRFNLANPEAGDPVPENATGYTIRWLQWMIDVHKVDGFRLDAAKHVPSWYWDTFYDPLMHNRRVTPDGRRVTPISFGECVEGNGFCFDRYVRKPNGRTTGRLAAGDAFGNRDVLDLSGAGRLRNNIGSGGPDNLATIINDHIDTTDDGFNNGTVGFNHIWSHDNGTSGTGSVLAPIPTARQQGWYMHAYLLMRTGPSVVFYNGRGINRSGPAFYPRQGVPVSLGQDGSTTNLEPVIQNLVRLSNWLGRGEFTPRFQDGDTLVFERRSRSGNVYSGNCIVGINDRYDGGYDTRTITTSFPQGTRLLEMTGNATSSLVDPNNDLYDTINVGAGGQVIIRVPRNLNSNNVEHNRGFVVYAPAIPSGTLTINNTSGVLAADAPATSAFRRRLNSMPIVSGNTFEIQLVTTNGDALATNNDFADDNAVFRINQGYEDWNGSGAVDIDYTNGVVPGYEQFVTQRQPLANTNNTQGNYRQTIDATRLDEGVNFVSVAAFRKRQTIEGPLYREFRTAIYVDRIGPEVQLTSPCPLPTGTTSFTFSIKALDRTVNRVHLITNPPTVADPLTLANASNQAGRLDRYDYLAGSNSLVEGPNRLLLIAFEETGTGSFQYIDCLVGEQPCPADFNQDGGVDGDDVEAFFAAWSSSESAADVNFDGGVDGSDVEVFFAAWSAGGC